MNEQDFDDIGKRLYDMEAEPPKGGWDKIGGMLNVQPIGRFHWLKKHWWKPAILLLPAALYFTSGLLENKEPETISSVEQKSNTENQESTLQNVKTIDSSELHSTGTNEKVNGPDKKEVERKNIKPSDHNSDLNSNAFANESVKKIFKTDKENLNLNTPVVQKESAGYKIERSQVVVSDEDNEVQNANHIKAGNDNQLFIKDQSELTTVDSLNKERVITQSSLNSLVTTSQDSSSSETERDSLNLVATTIPSNQQEEKKEEETKHYGPWRISATVTPQFMERTVKPVSDEVLVTKAKTSGAGSSGFGFGLGIGRYVTNRFCIDAHLTYNKLQQEIFYSYTTGKIDTFLREKQPDESIRVTPLYESFSRDIRSEYQYGGLRVAMTYYFWAKKKTKFNLAFGPGVHYLIHSKVEENIDGWKPVNGSPNRFNYSVSAGAGFTYAFAPGWDLMINPSLTFMLGQIKNESVHYRINQRASGINIMVSKNLRFK